LAYSLLAFAVLVVARDYLKRKSNDH